MKINKLCFDCVETINEKSLDESKRIEVIKFIFDNHRFKYEDPIEWFERRIYEITDDTVTRDMDLMIGQNVSVISPKIANTIDKILKERKMKFYEDNLLYSTNDFLFKIVHDNRTEIEQLFYGVNLFYINIFLGQVVIKEILKHEKEIKEYYELCDEIKH
jgi:hypothetical protein